MAASRPDDEPGNRATPLSGTQLICSHVLSSGHGRAGPALGARDRLFFFLAASLSWSACRWRRAVRLICAGLVTAGRAVRLERLRWSRDRTWPPRWLFIVESRVVPRAAAKTATGKETCGVLLEDGQGPRPAGELAGDGDVGYDGVLPAGGEPFPALVQPLVALMAADPRRSGG